MISLQSSGQRFSGPLFITGMWRSGSSLLYALLNKHPRVGLMYEADLTLMREAFWLSGGQGWPDRWESWNGAVSRHGFDFKQLNGAGKTFRDAFEITHKEYARRKGADIWGDKSPDLYDRMVPLAKDFPTARFIVVWRDPGDTISSMQAAAGQGARFFQKPGMALRGLIGNRKLRHQCDLLLSMGVRVYEINYDDLVNDTDNVMRKVCDFLEIAYQPSLASLEGANRDSLHKGGHHSLLRGDKILARRRSQNLPDTTAQKIKEYVNLWSRHYNGRWPRHQGASAPEDWPDFIDRGIDHFAYHKYRGVDEFKRLVFCLAPVRLVRWHRDRKAKK